MNHFKKKIKGMILGTVIGLSVGMSTYGNLAYAKEIAGGQNEIIYIDELDNNQRIIGPNDIQSINLTQVDVQMIPNTPIREALVNNAEVIYRFRFQITAKKYNGQRVTDTYINKIMYTGPVVGQKFTKLGSDGIGYVDIDVRGAHAFTVYCFTGDNDKMVRSNIISITPRLEAPYQTKFLCTAYISALESDYSGSKVYVPGITDADFKTDFLENVKLNGSGKSDSGKFISYNVSTGKYFYGGPTTATGTTATVGRTIAVDPYYIPRAKVSGVWKRASVYIDGVGTRIAEDGGSAITGYHIDVYVGEGKKAVAGWGNAYRYVTFKGVNLTPAN